MRLLTSDLITTFGAVAFHFPSLGSLGGFATAEKHKRNIFNEFVSNVVNTEHIVVRSPPSLAMLYYLTQMLKKPRLFTYKLSIKIRLGAALHTQRLFNVCCSCRMRIIRP